MSYRDKRDFVLFKEGGKLLKLFLPAGMKGEITSFSFPSLAPYFHPPPLTFGIFMLIFFCNLHLVLFFLCIILNTII